jgi:hypothetical protein
VFINLGLFLKSFVERRNKSNRAAVNCKKAAKNKKQKITNNVRTVLKQIAFVELWFVLAEC